MFMAGLVATAAGLLVPDPVRRVWALDRTMLAPVPQWEAWHTTRSGSFMHAGFSGLSKVNLRIVATMADGSVEEWPMREQADGSLKSDPLPHSVMIEAMSFDYAPASKYLDAILRVT
jgi:hypothetical protein